MSAKSKKAKKNEKTEGQQVTDYFMSMLLAIYVFAMLVVYPLYYHNKYFDMSGAKYTFFQYVSIFFLIFFLVFAVSWLIVYRGVFRFKTAIAAFSKTDFFAVFFLIFSYLSYFASDYQFSPMQGESSALTGYSGWYMGLLSQVMFVIIFFAVSRFWKWSSLTLIAAVIASGVANQLAVLHRFSIDPLGMYQNLAAEYIEKFVSTLGQTTWFSSYMVLLFPLGAFLYWHDDRYWMRILSGFYVALGFGTLCTVNSDSAYVAFVLILMVFFWFSLESNKSFKRFLEIVLIGLVSFRVIGLMQISFPEKMIQLITGDEKISFFITQSNFMLICLIVFAVLYIGYCILCFYLSGRRITIIDRILRKFASLRGQSGDDKKKPSQRPVFEVSNFLWLRKVMLAAAAIVLIGVALLIVLTTNRMLPKSLSGLYEVGFFNFNDKWGNCRGFNWRMAIKAFISAPAKDRLIGVGPDCFAMSMDKYCYEEVSVFWRGMQLACAHNEFLNMLVTQGILGLTAYLGIFISFIIRCISYGSKNKKVIPFLAAALAYLGHNFFCYQQCICTPTVFILMGIGEMLMREKDCKTDK